MKVGVTTVISLISSVLGVLWIPVCLLVLCNVIDYITGIMAANNRDEKVSSYKGIKGICKKICMWLLVIVGAILDQLILYSSQTIGIKVPFTFLVACVVAIWLICNELISILENIADIGTPLPPFLIKVIKVIKIQTENKIPVDFEETESEDK